GVGTAVGTGVATTVGTAVGAAVGSGVGSSVGEGVGSLGSRSWQPGRLGSSSHFFGASVSAVEAQPAPEHQGSLLAASATEPAASSIPSATSTTASRRWPIVN